MLNRFFYKFRFLFLSFLLFSVSSCSPADRVSNRKDNISSSDDLIDVLIDSLSSDDFSMESDVNIDCRANISVADRNYQETFIDSSTYIYSDNIVKETLDYDIETYGYSYEVYSDYLYDTEKGSTYVSYETDVYTLDEMSLTVPRSPLESLSSSRSLLDIFSINEDDDCYFIEANLSCSDAECIWKSFNGNTDCTWTTVFIFEDGNEENIPLVNVKIKINKDSMKVVYASFDISQLFDFYLACVYGLEDADLNDNIEIVGSTCEMNISYGKPLNYAAPESDG